MYCSQEIILANSCYIDNWSLIITTLTYILSVSVVFGFIISLVLLSVNKK